MGETHETETLPSEMTPAAAEKTVTVTRKSRRNGLWNIFEGVDNTVLEKLGLSEEVVHQIVTEADNTVTQHLATHMDNDYDDDDDNAVVSIVTDGGTSSSRSGTGTANCHCRKARILRSFSATVGEEVKFAQQNRHRRNAVGNLFDVLTPSQKVLLVEHLQEQLERLHCLCRGPRQDAGEVVMKSAPAAVAATTTKNHHEADSNISNNISNNSSNSSSGGIFLALTDFSSTSSSSSSSSSSSQPGPATSSVVVVASSSSPKEEVVCH